MKPIAYPLLALFLGVYAAGASSAGFADGGIAESPAMTPSRTAGSSALDSRPPFAEVDSNDDAAISLEEAIEAGMDDLLFRAMDIDGDGSVSPEEYEKRLATEREDALQTKPGVMR